MTVFRVTFQESRQEIRCPADENILDVAEDAAVDIDSLCRAGTCGTCKVRVVEGKTDSDATYGLTPAEVEAGFVLTCSTRPCSDLVLDA